MTASAAIARELARLGTAPAVVAQRSAPRILVTAKDAMRTKRGNDPEYASADGRFINLPTTATPTADGVLLRGADWALDPAMAKGLPDAIDVIVGDVVADFLEGK